MQINKKQKIYFEGVSACEIADRYGTPTYVYEENKIRENYLKSFTAFKSAYEKFRFFYAIKANNNPAIVNILKQCGAGIDAASVSEIQHALQLGFSGEQVIFSGNYLSNEDLEQGLKSKVIFNLDDVNLLDRLLAMGQPEIISFRINPGYGRSDVGDFVTNGGAGAKFGIHPRQVFAAYKKIKDAGIKRVGVHMMPGSCIREPEYFAYITELLMDIIGPVAKKLDLELEFIDIGGGLGIPYTPGEDTLDVEATAVAVANMFRKKLKEYALGEPWLFMEPARYFVANSGFVVGKVHLIKKAFAEIVGTDVGMNVLTRPVLYGAYHHIYVDRKEHTKRKLTNLCGQICENTDFWVKNRNLSAEIAVDDLIVVDNAGAYGFGMSYGYNGRLRAAEVLVNGDKHYLIRKRETLEYSLQTVSLPDHLK